MRKVNYMSKVMGKAIFPLLLLILNIAATEVYAVPIRDIPDLKSITFYEVSGHLRTFTFGKDSQQLTTKLADPLIDSNYDFFGVPNGYYYLPGELYDLYYSDAYGNFQLNGEYISVTAVYARGRPWGGGLNISEVGLDFYNHPTEYANEIASFVTMGWSVIPSSVPNAVDGDLNTFTTMGSTLDQSGRLRLTLGFASSSVPEPASLALFGMGLAGVFGLKKKR